MTWNAVTASLQGRSHRKVAAPCQDDGVFLHLPGGVIAGAVSDGAGSARHSQVAAKLSTSLALKYLVQWRNSRFTVESRDFAEDLLKQLRLILHGVSGILHSNPRDLACTLIAYLSTPHFLIAIQLGDGFLVVRRQGEVDYELLFKPEHGEYVNQTVFVIDPESPSLAQACVLDERVDFICASTDGLERLAINLRSMQPHAPFFRPFDEYLAGSFDATQAHKELLNFLSSPNVNARADDDLTLQLAAWVAGREAQP